MFVRRARRLSLLLALTVGCAGEVQLTRAPDASSDDASDGADIDVAARVDAPRDVGVDVDPVVARGALVFRMQCAICHGARGAGSGDGPDLRPRVPARTDDALRRVIRDGARMMPPPPLDDGQRADVFAFLRATFGSYMGP